MMHVDKKVGFTLEGIGFALLVLAGIFNLPIFWPVFGMACLLAGTYEVVRRLIIEKYRSQGA